ncbi:hypothetical protein DM50_2931 [Burkholderia mallei]|nr:hypothetical protein DM75_3545 [Burkholderia mallei]KOT00419.1 hypothetical protein DM50_2931 [Burkholderia mallei]
MCLRCFQTRKSLAIANVPYDGIVPEIARLVTELCLVPQLYFQPIVELLRVCLVAGSSAALYDRTAARWGKAVIPIWAVITFVERHSFTSSC